MGGSQCKRSLVSILKLHHLGTVIFPASGLFPNSGRLGNRHQKFLRSRPVHLFTDNLSDLTQNPVSQWKIGEDSSCNLSDKSSSNKELIALKVRIGRSVFQCWRV